MGSPTWGGCTPPTAIASLTAHWSPVTGHQSLVTSHRSPLIAHRTLRTGTVHRTLRTMHCTSHHAQLDPGEPNATRARPRQGRMGAQQAWHSCVGLRAAPRRRSVSHVDCALPVSGLSGLSPAGFSRRDRSRIDPWPDSSKDAAGRESSPTKMKTSRLLRSLRSPFTRCMQNNVYQFWGVTKTHTHCFCMQKHTRVVTCICTSPHP